MGIWMEKVMALVEDSRLRLKLPDRNRMYFGRGPFRFGGV